MTEWIQCGDTLTTPFRVCFSSVPPSVLFIYVKVPTVLLLHIGNVVPLHIFNKDIIHTLRQGAFPPPKKTVRRCVLFNGLFYYHGKHVHYLCLLVFSKASPFLSLAGAQHGSPPYIWPKALSNYAGVTALWKAGFTRNREQSFGNMSSASGYQDLEKKN